MKKAIFLLAFCAAGTLIFAQDHKHTPPQSVRSSYQKDYPDYTHSTWTMENNEWHTRYTDKDHGNRHVDVYYDRKGNRLQSKSRWDHADLPNAIKDRMSKRYHASNYTAYRIDKPGKGVYYQLSWGHRKVYMDESGNEVKY